MFWGISKIKSPPPFLQIRQVGQFFWNAKNTDVPKCLNAKGDFRKGANFSNNLKTVQSSKHMHFWRNGLLLVTKNAVDEKG